MSYYQIEESQWIPASIEKVWDFISQPTNLKLITPAYMDFRVLSKNLPEKMYPGMIITYTVKPMLGIPLHWMTEITHVQEHRFFVDEQRYGPYKLWHHQHHIEEKDSGVLMTDLVNYIPPFGMIGDLANALFIKKQLKSIFEFRKKAVQNYFNKT